MALDIGTARSPKHVPVTPDPTFVLGVPVNWFNIQWIGGIVAQPGFGPRHGGPNTPQGGQNPFAPNIGSPINGTDVSVNVAVLLALSDAVTPAPTIDAAFQQMSPNSGAF